jgi:hypothetical protein
VANFSNGCELGLTIHLTIMAEEIVTKRCALVLRESAMAAFPQRGGCARQNLVLRQDSITG